MFRKFLCAGIASIVLLSFESLSPAETIGVLGVVFEDVDRDDMFDIGDTPLQGVLVSDGNIIAVTDEEGAYEMRTQADNIVFVSVPGSHHAPENKFYARLDELSTSRQKIDFPLVRNADVAEDKKFAFVFASDTHAAHARSAKEGITKAYEMIASQEPALVIHGGDIIFDGLRAPDQKIVREQYDLYGSHLLPLIGAPFYHTLGNHDIFGWTGLPDPDPVPRLYGKEMYKKYFGPTYYSFNYEHCHFVVLDSLGRAKNEAGQTAYYGSIDDAQLEWLRKDLSEVERSSPIIIVTHIPTINALGSLYGLRTEIVLTPDGERTAKHQVHNFQQLFGDVLKGYNLKLALAGHYHTFERIYWKDSNHDALFVVGGSICGEWWKGDRVVGYSSWPEGFTLIKVDGNEFDVSYIPYGWSGVEEQMAGREEASAHK